MAKLFKFRFAAAPMFASLVLISPTPAADPGTDGELYFLPCMLTDGLPVMSYCGGCGCCGGG